MRINCFRSSGGASLPDDFDQAPRAPRKKAIKRQGSNQSNTSRCSSASNSSISKLPPCKRPSDPKIEAMMMAVPEEQRVSRCLRLSHPKLYSGIVESMKQAKGCRDWRNFDVFHDQEVDMTLSAEAVARKRAADFERKFRQYSEVSDCRSIEVDMIG